ncbi:uncharacterized protein LOC110742347 [Papio anubis]|uniref:uncharacterized protein LOC110742347 n=1 Tax=Papio anubis TaxID=9555 RepID=UPI0012AE40D8|nr:uncharacterized protein LOC110742347 [Papio anubis]
MGFSPPEAGSLAPVCGSPKWILYYPTHQSWPRASSLVRNSKKWALWLRLDSALRRWRRRTAARRARWTRSAPRPGLFAQDRGSGGAESFLQPCGNSVVGQIPVQLSEGYSRQRKKNSSGRQAALGTRGSRTREEGRGTTATWLLIGWTETQRFPIGCLEYIPLPQTKVTCAGPVFQKSHRPNPMCSPTDYQSLTAWWLHPVASPTLLPGTGWISLKLSALWSPGS